MIRHDTVLCVCARYTKMIAVMRNIVDTHNMLCRWFVFLRLSFRFLFSLQSLCVLCYWHSRCMRRECNRLIHAHRNVLLYECRRVSPMCRHDYAQLAFFFAFHHAQQTHRLFIYDIHKHIEKWSAHWAANINL